MLLYLRYKRLLNPRVIVRPPQTHWWQVSLKNESAAHPGEILSQLKQYHKQPLFFRCYWVQAVFHWITSSNKGSATFSQIDFKQRHKTNTWIWNSANQALLIKKPLMRMQREALPLFERYKSILMLWMQVKAAAPRAPGLMEVQPKHCCSAWTLQPAPWHSPQWGSDLCHCSCWWNTFWDLRSRVVRINKSHLMTVQMQTIRKEDTESRGGGSVMF